LDYILQADDVITVSVVGFPAFSGDFLIPPSGVVDLPILGIQKISEMSISQLTQLLTRGMSRRLKNPEVIVSLKIPRIDRIFVVGDVHTPGMMPYRPGWRLAQAVSASGGLIEGLTPSDFHVAILRGDKRLEYYLPDVLAGKADSNPELMANDVISLTAGALVPVNVVGEVRTPGLYRLKPEMNSILAAVAAAGGATDSGRISHVQIRHLDGTDEIIDLTPELVKGTATDLPQLRGGDLIIVPQTQNRFAVLGAATNTGIFPIPEGKTLTLADALAMSKSSDASSVARARYARIGLITRENGKEGHYVYDFGRYLAKGDSTQNPIIHPYDVIYVPQSSRVEVTTILGALGLVALFEQAFRH
jgi:protein involved in polysaccharide export with SLBB domain